MNSSFSFADELDSGDVQSVSQLNARIRGTLQTQFDSVWVSGEMTVKAAKKNLYLVDGASGIDVGYTLEASEVEPYKK